jgi:hypothetical protein
MAADALHSMLDPVSPRFAALSAELLELRGRVTTAGRLSGVRLARHKERSSVTQGNTHMAKAKKKGKAAKSRKKAKRKTPIRRKRRVTRGDQPPSGAHD